MWLLLCLALLILDQLSKYFTVTRLAYSGSVQLIPNVLHITYVENRGMAFGLLQGQVVLFSFVIVFAVIGILYFYFKKTTKDQKLLRLSLMMILAGALGNYIDRWTYGFVVDMIDVRLFSFWNWVFNLADMYIVIGCILLFIYYIFIEGKKEKMA